MIIFGKITRIILACACLLVPHLASAQGIDDWKKQIAEASKKAAEEANAATASDLAEINQHLADDMRAILQPLQGTWRGLVVQPENRCSPYRQREYRYPPSVEYMIVESLGGRVYGPYTKRLFASTRATDIEHIVARSEAHDSGLCAASYATRLQFASDLTNLTLAGPAVNRYQKIAKDAAEWMPAENKCWYAGRIVSVKRAYALTVDVQEALALEHVLAACDGTDLE